MRLLILLFINAILFSCNRKFLDVDSNLDSPECYFFSDVKWKDAQLWSDVENLAQADSNENNLVLFGDLNNFCVDTLYVPINKAGVLLTSPVFYYIKNDSIAKVLRWDDQIYSVIKIPSGQKHNFPIAYANLSLIKSLDSLSISLLQHRMRTQIISTVTFKDSINVIHR